MFLIKDAVIWTHDGMKNWICFNAGIITGIGTGQPSTEVLQNCQVIPTDPGTLIIPGLIDSHIHVQMYGESKIGLNELNLSNCKSLVELVDAVKAFETANPYSPVVVGKGFDQNKLKLDKLTRTDIDTIHSVGMQPKPIVLYRNCLHLCVLNSFALELFGLLPPSPANGPKLKSIQAENKQLKEITAYLQAEIVKAEAGKSLLVDIDPDTKLPTGILRETALFEVKKYFYSQLSREIKVSHYERGLFECLSRGLTCVQSNDFYAAWPIYKSLVNERKLPLRVYLTVPYDEVVKADEAQLEDELVPLPDDQIGLLSCHRVKLFADGSLGAMTAAMRGGYNCKCAHEHGILIESEKDLTAKVKDAKSRGYRLEIHVIGDLATEIVLKSLAAAGVTDSDRPILTHCQILGNDLIDKMAKAGVIANIQPSFVPSDAAWALKCLTSNDLEYSYSWKKLINAGVVTAGGSDAPVEDASPFWGMHAAIFRTYQTNETASVSKPSQLPVFKPEERLSFNEAIHMYTKAGAFTAGDEDNLGQLNKGFKADFVMIDLPIWESDNASPEAIDRTWNLLKQVKVTQVWIDGKRVFNAKK